MSTNSTIAVQHLDGTVSAVYCHWDGYLSYNGRILIDHYNSLEMAERLVDNGNISLLGDTIDTTKFFQEHETVYADLHEYLSNGSFQKCNYLWTEYDDELGNRVEGWLYSGDDAGFAYAATGDESDWEPVVNLLEDLLEESGE